MAADSRVGRAILDTELDDHIAELMRFAIEAGQGLARAAGREETAPVRPNAQHQLESQLRASLEDEIVPVSELQLGGIDQAEVDREIVKKALVGLKLATLKKIARDKGAPVGGSLEEIATRIARIYEWDQREVARLILANEEEPSIERAHISRLFPLEQRYNVMEAHDRLEAVVGRYIRIGVARWFLFQEMRPLGDRVEVSGTFKTYQASVDDVYEVASLSALAHDAGVRIMMDDSSVLQIHGASGAPSKAAVLAFEIISGTAAKGYLPLAAPDAESASSNLHPASEFLLDILYNRLQKTQLQDVNLTVARFRLGDEGSQGASNGERRPELKAVRFEGEHLLDSVAACRMLAVERRPLVEVAFQATVRGDDNTVRGRFPVRITTEKDHVAVQTGLGSGEHELSLDVHRTVINCVAEALEEGVADEKRVQLLFERMQNRANAEEDPHTATILNDAEI